MILFPCVHCGARLQVSARSAGRRSQCPTCRTPFTVPQPGAEFLRKRCADCGSEADAHHNGACDACGAGAEESHYWCARHRFLISEVVCPDCLQTFNQQSVPPAPKPELAEPILAETLSPTAVVARGRSVPPLKPELSTTDFPRIVEKTPTVKNVKGICNSILACGILALLTGLSCSCLGVLLGAVAVRLATVAQRGMRQGVFPRTYKNRVVAGGVCGGAGLFVALSGLVIGILRHFLGP